MEEAQLNQRNFSEYMLKLPQQSDVVDSIERLEVASGSDVFLVKATVGGREQSLLVGNHPRENKLVAVQPLVQVSEGRSIKEAMKRFAHLVEEPSLDSSNYLQSTHKGVLALVSEEKLSAGDVSMYTPGFLKDWLEYVIKRAIKDVQIGATKSEELIPLLSVSDK